MATLASARPASAAIRVPGTRLDWAVVGGTTWLLAGLFWDGWAHGYGLPDSFWTIWHAAFYSGYAALAVVLFAAVGRARASAGSFRAAIPAGYELAVVGAGIFAVGGVFDMLWHTAFGIETSTDALLSPSHLVLGLGVALMVTGPLLATWRRGTTGDLVALLPAVLSLTGVLCLFTFFSQFSGPYARVIGLGPRPSGAVLEEALLGVYLFSALVVGCALLMLRRDTLPIGAMTVMLGLNAVAMILMRGHTATDVQVRFVAVAVAAGLVADAMRWRLRPSVERVGALRLFAFLVPAVYFALYLAVVAASLGTGWTVHSLTGIVLLSGVIGLLVSFVFVAPDPRVA